MSFQLRNTASLGQLAIITFIVGILHHSETLAASQGSTDSGLQIGLSGLFSVGGSSLHNHAIEEIQAGGHDPNRNGFTIQNVELSLTGTIDPWFDAQASIIFLIDAEGETVVELEEVFVTTRQLPGGLQIKAGQYFTEFGRHNQQHPHQWQFVDQPVILSRLFGGDGLRSQGLRLSWLTPFAWYSEMYISLQNAAGETAHSFLSVEDEEIGGYVLLDRQSRNFSDLLYAARWLNGFDLGDNLSMNIGLSALRGPNASGLDADTRINGIDVFLKWQPVNNEKGFPFLSWHTEYLDRSYDAGDSSSPAHETLKDDGYFTQLNWGFTPGWTFGLRWEQADGNGDNFFDPLRDSRKRTALNLAWYPSEYSKLRIQYNRDKADHLGNETGNSLWLQLEFNLGSHMAHKF